MNIVLVLAIISILIIAGILYFYRKKSEINDDDKFESYEFFSISMEKIIFNESSTNEPINVSFRLYNNQNRSIIVSDFLFYHNLHFSVCNSSGEPYKYPVLSLPGPYNLTLSPRMTVIEKINIKNVISPYWFVADNYTIQGRYINFHSPDTGLWDAVNRTFYESNNITFYIV
jgi:hypothetical protein